MRSYLQYFRKRSVELPIWLGIPFIGVFLTVEQPPIGRLILFAVAATLAISHLLLVNDWGGLKRTPLEMNRYQDVEDTGAFSRMLRNTAVLTLPIAVLVGFFLLPPELLLGLGVSGILLSVLYSHPSIHLKEDPILSNVLHLLGGTLLFVLGVAVFAGDVAKGITIGLFFGMILMGGHFIHECIDHDEDNRHQTRTSATTWGISHAARLGIATFFVAHLYLLFLAFLGIMAWSETVLFSLPAAVHISYCRTVIGAATRATRTRLLDYRRLYRLSCAQGFLGHLIAREYSQEACRDGETRSGFGGGGGSPEGDRRRRRGGPIFSRSEARGGAASVTRGSS